MSAYWLNQIIKLAILWSVQYATGQLVHHKGVKVNYTRKINHFALLFVPMWLDKVIAYQQSFGLFITGCILALVSLTIYIKPIRSRVRFIERMFMSIDRPEDRPHTLLWLSTQIAAGFLVLIPAVIIFVGAGYWQFLFIPLLIMGIGDGLAEPVGVRFGRLKYSTYALFSKKKYVRTVEGSCCVLLTSIFVIIFHRHLFMPHEFIAALIIIPILMTLAEAFSPHTWDTPFLFLTGYASLYFIKWFPAFG